MQVPARERTAKRAVAVAALTATLGVAAASWIVAVHQMDGMDMGVATELGSFPFFVSAWVSMMAAMMLPGAASAALGRTLTSGRVLAMPPFVGSYLAVWALVGVAVYALYRPHGTAFAGALTIVAGFYELTPLQRHFRRRCRELGVMSVAWMSIVAVLIVGQKLLPPRASIDTSLGLAIVALGILVVLAPSVVPGLTQAM